MPSPYQDVLSACRQACLSCVALLPLQVIRRVDPPSEGVEMARTQSISLDVSAHVVVAHFGGVEEVRLPTFSNHSQHTPKTGLMFVRRNKRCWQLGTATKN